MRPRISKSFVAAAVTCISLLTWSLAGSAAGRQGQYADWDAAIWLGTPINSDDFEYGPAISKDGLSLYFHGRNDSGYGGSDLWVSQRASTDEPWGEPQNLGTNINTPAVEAAPALSRNGHFLFFHSNRAGGFGQSDLYVSYRQFTHDDFGWESPTNLGSLINSTGNDQQSFVLEDDETGSTMLYFGSNRGGGLGGFDLYVSLQQADGSFGPASRIAELASTSNETGPSVRHDGKEIFFTSDRAGGFGLDDIWVSTRESTSEPWSTPVNLGPLVNTPHIDGWAELSHDGRTLFFGGPSPNLLKIDLWMATRSRLRGR